MNFSGRLMAMIRKETLQLRRDRLTFAMMFGMPIMQLLLFGYAINNIQSSRKRGTYSDSTAVMYGSVGSGVVGFQSSRKRGTYSDHAELTSGNHSGGFFNSFNPLGSEEPTRTDTVSFTGK